MTARWLAAAGLAGWLAVCVGLVAVQARALTVEPLASGELMAAVDELLVKLGHEGQECRVQAVEPATVRGAPRSCFRVECPERVLFIKHDPKHDLGCRADELSAAFALIEARMPRELAAAVLQPLAIFSFIEKDAGGAGHKAWLSAYPWIEGATIGDVLEHMSETGFDLERLQALYSRIGTLLGSLHGAGVIEADQPIRSRASRLIHEDLHDQNIMVTPEDQIVFLDPDALSDPRWQTARLVDRDIIRFAIWCLTPRSVVYDGPCARDWLAIEPALADSFQQSYCRALVGEQQQAACVAEVAELLYWDKAFQSWLEQARYTAFVRDFREHFQ